MAFGLEANTRMTQVLFVRHRASDATLRHCAGRVAIDTVVLGGVRDALRQKLTSHAQSFIKALPDLDLPPAGSPTRGRSR